MNVLGIETSCDDTSAAVVNEKGMLSNVVSSQVDLHKRFSGVVPELASRAHLQRIAEVIDRARVEAGNPELDAIAYTRGPGLMGPLLVGKVAAQTLARYLRLPLVGVNHLEGHIFAVELAEKLRFPMLSLIVSGGHTELVLAKGPGKYKLLGCTRDDAAGEAYDKVARLLGLEYPGGPVIDRLAAEGDPAAVPFPRPLMPGTWDFSFAGLKTAVLYYLKDHRLEGKKLPPKLLRDLCASFQEAVAQTLVAKLMDAAEKYRIKEISIGGGVAANSRLRALTAEKAAERGLRAVIPARVLCTDNAAMIAKVALHRLKAKRVGKVLRSDPGLDFENWAK